MNPIDDDFVLFCNQATDAQLVNIIRDEFNAYQHRDYPSALKAAAQRGWTVLDGEVYNK
jgi:hypothetical protein